MPRETRGIPWLRAVGLVLLFGLTLPGPGAVPWAWSGAGVRLRLEPLPPESVAAFYAARGFPAAEAARIAGACVLQTKLINDSGTELEVDLSRWRIRVGPEPSQPLPDRRSWLRHFTAAGVSRQARIAFEWSQFPWRAHLEPGERLQGMILYGLEPGTRFHVTAPIRVGGRWHEAHIEDVRCPSRDAAAQSKGGKVQ